MLPKPLNKEAAFLYIEKLSQQLPYPIYWLNLAGEIIGGNQAALDYFGFDQPSFLFGQTLYELYPQGLADQINEHSRPALLSGDIVSQCITSTDREGKTWRFKAMKIPLKNEMGHIIGLVILPEPDHEHISAASRAYQS